MIVGDTIFIVNRCCLAACLNASFEETNIVIGRLEHVYCETILQSKVQQRFGFQTLGCTSFTLANTEIDLYYIGGIKSDSRANFTENSLCLNIKPVTKKPIKSITYNIFL